MNSLLLLAQANNNPDAAAGAGAAGVFGGLLALGAIFWVIAIAATVFWVWMLIDVLTSNKPTNDKILWFLVVFFLHLVGALVYFFVGRGSRGTSTAPA